MEAYESIVGQMPVNHEMADWGTDPESQATVIRMTSSSLPSRNIYCEQPYCSPDGRRFLIERIPDVFSLSRQLIVADLNTLHLTLVEPEIIGTVVHSPWSEWAYYQINDGSLRRVSLLTMERQAVLPRGILPLPPKNFMESITPDNRWIIANERMDGTENSSWARLRTYAFDIETGRRKVIGEEPDNCNPHIQAERHPSRRYLVRQLVHRGETTIVRVLVHDLDTGRDVQLPIGDRWSAESTGHMAWIGTTGRVACTVNWVKEQRRHDSRNSQGNLVIAGPGDARCDVFPAPQFAFYHVSISRCGRYFVCDECMDFRMDAFREGAPKPIRIVMGNLTTGKYRVLISDCQAYGIAGTSFYEPVPYLTADNRHVIYNASPFGIVQVFVARVPDEFLNSLD